MAIPRRCVSSRARLFDDSGALETAGLDRTLNKLWQVLNAAQTSCKVYLVSLGFGASLTKFSNVVDIAWTGPHVKIALVVAVPGSLEAFPWAPNGIRYGMYEMGHLKSVIEGTALEEYVARGRVQEYMCRRE